MYFMNGHLLARKGFLFYCLSGLYMGPLPPERKNIKHKEKWIRTYPAYGEEMMNIISGVC